MARAAWKTGSDIRPAQGNRELPLIYDFSTVATFNDDLSPEQYAGEIDLVQSVLIDNSDNPQPLVIQLRHSCTQRIVCPALSQGIFPVLATGRVTYSISTTIQAGLKIPVTWSNVKREFKVWGPVTVNIAAVNATFTPIASAFTDFSGNAGASAQVFAANALAKRRIVRNPSGSNNSIFINFGGVAASAATFEIPPGQSFDTGSGPIDQTQWMIFAPAATAFNAYQSV